MYPAAKDVGNNGNIYGCMCCTGYPTNYGDWVVKLLNEVQALLNIFISVTIQTNKNCVMNQNTHLLLPKMGKLSKIQN